jgi:hypothetical protein
MKTIRLILALGAIAAWLGCQPKPIDIEIEQGAPILTISSATTDKNTLVVSVGYSTNSLKSLDDTTGGTPKIPAGMLLRNAVVTLSSSHNSRIDTLPLLMDGIYGSTELDLVENVPYTLNVFAEGKGLIGTATTTYFDAAEPQTVLPGVKRTQVDTSVRLALNWPRVNTDDYYFVSYFTTKQKRRYKPSPYAMAASLASFQPAQLFLFSAADARHGSIAANLPLHCSGNDTLIVHVGKIDQAYFNYLTSYKKTGVLINQLTGEPINLPSNVMKGLGFFTLSVPARYQFFLNEY